MPSRTNGVGVQVEDTKICVVMVGLPARGKSYIAQRGQYSHTPMIQRRLTISSPAISTMALYPSPDLQRWQLPPQ